MDVRLPNGQVITNVPDGMRQDELVSRLKANGYDTSWYKPPSWETRAANKFLEIQSKKVEHPIDTAVGTAAGAAEVGLQMGSGLAAAVPAIGYGLHNVTQGRPFAEGFQAAQEAGTYEPRTEVGKGLSGVIGEAFHAYSTKLVDPAADAAAAQWGPLAGAVVKTLGEGIPLVAPFAPRWARQARGAFRGPQVEPGPGGPPASPRPAPPPAAAPRPRFESDVAPETLKPEAPAEPPVQRYRYDDGVRDYVPVGQEPPRPAVPPIRPEPVPDVPPETARPPAELEAQTEASLAARRKAISDAATAEQLAIEAAEGRRRADLAGQDFELTGSDRAADQFGSRQGELAPVAELATAEMTKGNVPERLPTYVLTRMIDRDRLTQPSSTDLKALTKDIKKRGIQEPVTITVSVADKEAYVTDGNNRIAAARALKLDDVPVRFVRTDGPFTPEQSLKSMPLETLKLRLEDIPERKRTPQQEADRAEMLRLAGEKPAEPTAPLSYEFKPGMAVAVPKQTWNVKTSRFEKGPGPVTRGVVVEELPSGELRVESESGGGRLVSAYRPDILEPWTREHEAEFAARPKPQSAKEKQEVKFASLDERLRAAAKEAREAGDEISARELEFQLRPNTRMKNMRTALDRWEKRKTKLAAKQTTPAKINAPLSSKQMVERITRAVEHSETLRAELAGGGLALDGFTKAMQAEGWNRWAGGEQRWVFQKTPKGEFTPEGAPQVEVRVGGDGKLSVQLSRFQSSAQALEAQVERKLRAREGKAKAEKARAGRDKKSAEGPQFSSLPRDRDYINIFPEPVEGTRFAAENNTPAQVKSLHEELRNEIRAKASAINFIDMSLLEREGLEPATRKSMKAEMDRLERDLNDLSEEYGNAFGQEAARDFFGKEMIEGNKLGMERFKQEQASLVKGKKKAKAAPKDTEAGELPPSKKELAERAERREAAPEPEPIEEALPEAPPEVAAASEETTGFPEGATVRVSDMPGVKDKELRKHIGKIATIEGYGGEGVFLKFAGESASHDWPIDMFKLEPVAEASAGPTLVQTIRKMGGVEFSELRDITGETRLGKHVKGIAPGLFKKKGLGLDDLATQLKDKGFDIDVDAVDGGVQQLRDMIREELEGVREHRSGFEERRSRGGTLNSGFPVEELLHTFNWAMRAIKDAFGVKEADLEIIPRDLAKSPGVLAPFRSPRELARKIPELMPIVARGVQAVLEQDTLRDVFNRRLDMVERTLGGGLQAVKDFGKSYAANKKLLHEILIEGDLLGKRFSSAELRSMGAGREIEIAYNMMRAAYDHAWKMASSVRELRGKTPVGYREGFIPHYFHNWFIVVEGSSTKLSAKTLREAISMSNPLVRAGEKVTLVPKQFEFPGDGVQAAVVGDIAFFKMREALEKNFELTPEEASQLLDGVVRLRGRSRFVGNFLQRKGVEGWEHNLDWAHRHYFNMISRYVALDKFKSNAITYFERKFNTTFDREQTGVAKYAKDYINDLNGVPTAIEELLNSSLERVPVLNKFLGNYLGERPALQIAGMTTNAVAIAKLGLYNVSAAMVNASQLMMVNALLGERWTAYGLYKTEGLVKTLAGRRVGIDTATNPDIGLIRQMGIPVAQGLESGAGYSRAAQMGRLFQASTAFFRGVEFQLRATAGLGAYYKGIAEGMSKQDALAYARDINRRANFDYSIADAPGIIRRAGPLGQVLLQFKKFPIKALEFMSHLEGAQHARFWIPFVLISGYYAFPGVEAIKNMVLALTDVDIELEAKAFLMEWAGKDPTKRRIANTIMYGIASNLGVDLSRRVGGGDFIPAEGSDLAGPAFSSIVRAAQLASRGAWAEALRAISSAPGNALVALKNDGEITSPWDRDRRLTKLEPGEQALKALGVATAKESIQRDVSRIQKYRLWRQRQKEQDAIDDLIKAHNNNDQNGIRDAIRRMVELQMSVGGRVSEEAMKKQMDRAWRTFLSLPDKEKARNMRLMDFLKE